MKQWMWFGGGFFAGLVTLSISFASVPRSVPLTGQVKDDSAIYQNLSEISVPRQQKPDFDNDISRLSQMEGRYQEKNLARHPRLSAPIQRVSHQKYRYSGKPSKRPVAPRTVRAKQRSAAPVVPGVPTSAISRVEPVQTAAAPVLPTAPMAAAPSMGVPEEPTLKKLDLGRAQHETAPMRMSGRD